MLRHSTSRCWAGAGTLCDRLPAADAKSRSGCGTMRSSEVEFPTQPGLTLTPPSASPARKKACVSDRPVSKVSDSGRFLGWGEDRLFIAFPTSQLCLLPEAGAPSFFSFSAADKERWRQRVIHVYFCITWIKHWNKNTPARKPLEVVKFVRTGLGPSLFSRWNTRKLTVAKK